MKSVICACISIAISLGISACLGLEFDSYLWGTLRFSVIESLLTAFICVILGFFLSLAIFRQFSSYAKIITAVLTVSTLIPSIFIVIMIINNFGRSGVLTRYLHIPFNNYVYGLPGILYALVFMNLIFMIKTSLNILFNIPDENWKLAQQLDLKAIHLFNIFYKNILKESVKRSSFFIFLMCFSAFTIILALGGSPKNSTLQVVVYEYIYDDFNMKKALAISILQAGIIMALIFLIPQKSNMILDNKGSNFNTNHKYDSKFISSKIMDYSVFIVVIFIFILPVCISILRDLMNINSWSILISPQFISALIHSLITSFFATLISVILGFAILLNIQHHKHMDKIINISTMLFYIIPSFALAVILFEILSPFISIDTTPFILVSLINGIISTSVFIYIVYPGFQQSNNIYGNLSRNLNISWSVRLVKIHMFYINKPLRFAISIIFCWTMGDMNIIALFGNGENTTLAYLAYELMSKYQTDKAELVGLFIFMLSLFIVLIVNYQRGQAK